LWREVLWCICGAKAALMTEEGALIEDKM